MAQGGALTTFRESLLQKAFKERENGENKGNDVKIQEIGNALVSALNQGTHEIAFNNPTLGDIQLQLNNDPQRTFHVTKAILVTKSAFFKTLFMHGLEWIENQETIVNLNIEETLLDVFEEFLMFFYSGTIAWTKAKIWPFYFLADQFIVTSLQKQVAYFACNIILELYPINRGETSFVFLPYISSNEALEFVRYFDDEKVKRFASAIVLRGFNEISQTNFNCLDKETVMAILNAEKIFDNSEPTPPTRYNMKKSFLKEQFDEYKLFNKIIGWIKSEPERRAYAEEVLLHIRYGRFKNIQQLKEVSRNTFVQESSKTAGMVALVCQEILFKNSASSCETFDKMIGSDYYQEKRGAHVNLSNMFAKRLDDEKLLIH